MLFILMCVHDRCTPNDNCIHACAAPRAAEAHKKRHHHASRFMALSTARNRGSRVNDSTLSLMMSSMQRHENGDNDKDPIAPDRGLTVLVFRLSSCHFNNTLSLCCSSHHLLEIFHLHSVTLIFKIKQRKAEGSLITQREAEGSLLI